MKGYKLLMNWKSHYIKKYLFSKTFSMSKCNRRKIPGGNLAEVYKFIWKIKTDTKSQDSLRKNKGGGFTL